MVAHIAVSVSGAPVLRPAFGACPDLKSEARTVGQIASECRSCRSPLRALPDMPLWLPAWTVDHNDNMSSLVGRAFAASWNFKRPRFVAFAFQVREHSIENHLSLVINARDIFANKPPCLAIPDNSKHAWPEEAVILRSASAAGEAVRLAGKAGADDIDSSVSAPIEPPQIEMNFAIWEILAQHHAAIAIELAECHGFNAGALET